MQAFWRYRLDHVLFWSATVFFHLYTRINLLPVVGWGNVLLEVLIRNLLLAIVIYVHLEVLIPKLQQRKAGIYFFSVLLLIVGYVVVKNAHDAYLYGKVLDMTRQGSFMANTYYNFSIVVFYLAFSVALHLSKAWYFQRQRLQQIEVEKLNTELAYLRSQINPHFLFNSLNTIYFQIDKQNTLARSSLSQFSEMLRYQLYECNGKEISIEKELNYIQNYVDLQRQRKDDNYKIDFEVGTDVRNFTLAPLLMIPFIENAFKYVSHYTDRKNEIEITIHRKGNSFLMRVSNTCDRIEKSERGGIGLANVKRRLELLYPDRHQLDIRETDDRFLVTLNVTLNPTE